MYPWKKPSRRESRPRLERSMIALAALSLLGAIYTGSTLPPAAAAAAHPAAVLVQLAGLSAVLMLFPLFFISFPLRYSLPGLLGCTALMGLLWVIAPSVFPLLFTLTALLTLPLYGAALFLIVPCEEDLLRESAAEKKDLEALAHSLELDTRHFFQSALRLFSAFLWAAAGGLLARGIFAATAPGALPDVLQKASFFLPLALIFFWALLRRSASGRAAAAGNGRLLPAKKSLLICSPQRVSRHTEPPLWPWSLPQPILPSALDVRRFPLFFFGLTALLALVVPLILLPGGAAQVLSAAESPFLHRLEILLGARPRFLEFALGYPLALLGLYLGGRPEPGATGRAARIFSAAGVLALLSASGAFVRPEFSIPAAFWGGLHSLWLGLVAGFVLLFTWKRLKFLGLLYRLYRRMEEQKKKGKKQP